MEVASSSFYLFNLDRVAVISALALCTYEYMITLFYEIRYVWRHKYTFATALFAFNRYAVWVETGILVYLAFGDLETAEQCTRAEKAFSIFVACHKLCIGLFCAFRLYAIWDREWSVFCGILLLYVVQTALFLTPNVLSGSIPLGPPFHGCMMMPQALGIRRIMQLQLASSALTIASDAMILGLTVLRTLRISVDAQRLGFKSPISSLLLRDGTVYFVALTALSITNIVAIRMGPTSPIFGIIPQFITQLRAILVSRFFLNLRHVFLEKSNSGPENPSSVKVKIPKFAGDGLVGNLGAPLRVGSVPGQRISASSGSSRMPLNQPSPRAGLDPLLDWDVDEFEEIDDAEITSSRPMFVGLEIDQSMTWETVERPLWRKDVEELGVEGEEAVSLVNQDGRTGSVQTTIQSTHPYSRGEGNMGPVWSTRRPSRTGNEGDTLLVDMDEVGYSWDHPRAPVTLMVNSDPHGVTPGRTSSFV